MATLKRLTILRSVVVVCSVTAVVLPVLLLYEQDKENYHTPLRKQQYIKFPVRMPKLSPEMKPKPRHLGRRPLQGIVPNINEHFILPLSERRLTKDSGRRIENSSLDKFSGPTAVKGLDGPKFDINTRTTGKANNGIFMHYDKSKRGSDSKSLRLEKTQNLWKNSSVGAENKCREVLKVAFLKTHKTGSTTIMNIIQRFGHVRNLVFVLPKSTNYLGFGKTVSPREILPAPRGQTYDLLINHVVYNREAFRQILPKEAIYVTIIRHPFEQFVSAIEYLKERLGYLKKLPTDNPVSEFLQNPSEHESKDIKWSFTNNRMSFDLGLDPAQFHNAAKVKQFVKALDEDFKLVMITGRIDESLLLLKKLLCWSLKDILYIPRNVNTKKRVYNFTTEDRQLHRVWAKSDYKLYEYFLEKFNRRVAAQGSSFREELTVFKSVLAKVKRHCLAENYRVLSLRIEETKWNKAFEITELDCRYMLLEEVPFLQQTRAQYVRKLHGFGVNRWAFRIPQPVRLVNRHVKYNNRRRPQYRRIPKRPR